MQSRLCSKALCPATITAFCPRSIQSPVCQQIAALARRRIHTDGGDPDTTREKYPELEDILGKPATTFEQLIGQLETLIKHPNPPRNYADALAKEELRRMDHRDLTPERRDGKPDPTRARLLQQRPRMLRHMNSELDRGLNAGDVGGRSNNDTLTDLNDTPDPSSIVSSTCEVPPLPEDVAINLGITAEQQERRRIWMTKISGYRAFRSNLMSMNSLLNNLDERRESEKASGGAAEQANDDKLSKDPLLGPGLDGKTLLDDDREFEELIRKSWKLYDEDFADPGVALTATSGGASKRSTTKPSPANGLGGTDGRRSFHSSRTVHDAPSLDKKLPKNTRVVKHAKKGNATPLSDPYSEPKTPSRDADSKGKNASQSDWETKRPALSRALSVRGHSAKYLSKQPQNLIKKASRLSVHGLRRHFAERDEYVGEIHVPIDATVSTGDLIEMRQTVNVTTATQYGVSIAIGGVVQKTTGRFHFNYVDPAKSVIGGREARLGFVAKGLLFDKKLLLRSGASDDDIKRILAYGKELREYEEEHGEHVLTNSYEALRLQRTFTKIWGSGIIDNDTEADSSVAMPLTEADGSLPDCQAPETLDGVAIDAGSSGAGAEVDTADSDESISELLVHTFPRALRTFRQEAEQLMRSHIRELSSYWGLAVGRGQTFVTVDSLARLTFGNRGEDEPLSEIERFAAYMHLVSDPLHFIPDADGLFVTGRFELRSKAEVENIVKVRDLIRENAPEFTQFIEKARKLVAYSHTATPLSPLRAALDPSAKSALAAVSCKLTGWTPDLTFAKRKLPAEPVLTKEEVDEIKFTPEDSQFLLALRSYVYHSNAGFQNLANPYEGLTAPILKKMNYYSGNDETSVARFLVDIGVWPHWYNQRLNMREQAHAGFHRYKTKYLVEKGATACAKLHESGISDDFGASARLANLGMSDDDLAACARNINLAKLNVPEVRPSIITQSSSGAGVISKSRLYDRDICESIRHDFGDMPVYTVDDSSTRDVDDGMSLETVVTASGEEQEWVHVHVADPTALIHPGHLIAYAAAQQMTSIYYTTETRNMLPTGLVLKSFSLVQRSSSSGSRPDPVNTMTFSFRLSDDGDIVDYKVRAGIVRNIIATPYEVVDQHLSYERPIGGMDSLAKLQESQRMTTYIHPFVPADSSRLLYGAKREALTEEAVRTLRRIQVLVRSHFDYRVRAGSFTRIVPSLETSVNNSRIVPRPKFNMERPMFLQGLFDAPGFGPLKFPKIVTSCSNVVLSPAHTMVSEVMIIAGRVAARFAYEHGPGAGSDGGGLTANSSGVITGERGVPMLFRSQSMPNLDVLSGVALGLPLGIDGLSAAEAQSARAVWDAVTGQARSNNGIVSAKVFDEVRHMLSPSLFGSTPGPHTIMGLLDKYGYTRVTSPIRRMDDMVGHWQLKAQMLAEHTGSKDQRPWYWNHYDIERLAPIVFRRSQLVDKATGMDNEFWILTLMRRMDSEARRGTLQPPPEGFYDANLPLYYDTPWAYYNPSSPGPLTWTATVDNREESRPFISLIITGLGNRAMLIPRPMDSTLLPFAGTKVRVQIVGLDPAYSNLMVKLAPEEYQPAETPKFWRSRPALNMIYGRFHLGRTPPEDVQQATTAKQP
ncbi:3'-5' RNA exonuclease complex component [Coemansia sp. RSA 2050]|nr:3'-5' RNA exonuclease complex component [Coemansia sp. RSA 2050]KAJ2732169.1 3'-5' RNA exonuclease complex component [Coemansia sp. BCRC 34962]